MKRFAQDAAWCLTDMGWDVLRGKGALHRQRLAEEEGDGAPRMHFQLVRCWSCSPGRKSCATFVQRKSLTGVS